MRITGLAVTILVLPLLCGVPLWAADSPRVEIFGGFSILSADLNEDGRETAPGLNLSVAGNANPWFGLVGDFSGHFRSQSLEIPGIGGLTADADVTLILFGPRFTFRGPGGVQPFVHTLVGAARAKAAAGIPVVGSVSASDTALATAFGGGLDIKAGGWLAFRALQADYIHTRFADSSQNSVRISLGIVFRLGDAG